MVPSLVPTVAALGRNVIWEVFLSQPTGRVEPLYETTHFCDQFFLSHAGISIQGPTAGNDCGFANCEAVGALCWTVEPNEVITKRASWLGSFADPE